MTEPGFIHLHLHSQYSLLDGAIRLKPMIKRVGEMKMDSVAVTDHGNLFGALEFYTLARDAGIKPIIGCEVYITPRGCADRTHRGYHLILLAMNNEGYTNLMYLVSKGYLEGFYYHPRIDYELLEKHSAGLIGASACLGGEIPSALRNEGYDRAKELAIRYRNMFEPGCFYLEVQDTGYAGQKELNQAFRKMGRETGLQLLATNDAHYLDAGDSRAHQVLMCIQKGLKLDDPDHPQKYSNHLYMKNGAEMRQALPGFEDAIENTVKVAEMCNVTLKLGETTLPDFSPAGGCSLDEHLREQAARMLENRLDDLEKRKQNVDREAYRERLNKELDVVCKMGYSGYYLIVHDIVDHAKNQRVPVGPGRGSGAGSLVAYALGITDIDPIRFGLLFERFLNPDRVSMPDFDIDFCKNRRDEVIAYVAEKYGKDNVGQIATFHQLKSRSVVRDVGRVMGMPYGDVDRIAKLIPETPGKDISISQLIDNEPQIKKEMEKDARVKTLMGYAEKLEGLKRHAGTHAAGVVISTKSLWETVPVFRGPGGETVTQFDKNMVEKAGLVKFDFLGLKTLTVLETALKLINKRPDMKKNLQIDKIPLDTPHVYAMLSRGDTTGVFQMESRGFRELLRRLLPDCIEDLVAAVALYRPGPLEGGMVDQFIDCKHGRSAVSYPHPSLARILEETYGVMVYQEQVMQAARTLAGFSLGNADIMRRAMGKKNAKEMAEQRNRFVTGCVKNGLSIMQANEIFDLIDKFAGYGFNKSHSAAYAMVAYRTAWLKATYPAEFLAALLTCDAENTDKVVSFIAEGRREGIKVMPPHINDSELDFSVVYPSSSEKKPSIRFGLGAVKGVGKSSLEAIFSARKEGRAFRDIFDFCSRVDLSHVNRSTLEALTKAGVFDEQSRETGIDRGRLFAVVDSAIERGRIIQRDRQTGQKSLFDFMDEDHQDDDNSVGMDSADYPGIEASWDESRTLEAEREALGLYMSGHPMSRYRKEAAKYADTATRGCHERENEDRVKVAGVVEAYKERVTRGGTRMASFFLEDLEGRIESIVYSNRLENVKETLTSGKPVLVTGHIRVQDGGINETPRIIVDKAETLSDVRGTQTSEILLNMNAAGYRDRDIDRLRDIISRHPGRCAVTLKIHVANDGVVHISLPDECRSNPTDQFLYEVKQLLGENTVDLV